MLTFNVRLNKARLNLHSTLTMIKNIASREENDDQELVRTAEEHIGELAELHDEETSVKVINTMRAYWQKVFLDEKDKFDVYRVHAFHLLQLCTYLIPLNQIEAESNRAVSIITLESFKTNNIYYSSCGYMLEHSELMRMDDTLFNALAKYKISHDLEKRALVTFLTRGNADIKSLLRHNGAETVIGGGLCLAYFGIFKAPGLITEVRQPGFAWSSLFNGINFKKEVGVLVGIVLVTSAIAWGVKNAVGSGERQVKVDNGVADQVLITPGEQLSVQAKKILPMLDRLESALDSSKNPSTSSDTSNRC